MKHIIITLKSRNDTLHLYNLLKSKNIICSTINTPRIIGSSCTLSVKVGLDSINTIYALIRSGLNISGVYIFDSQLNMASRLY